MQNESRTGERSEAANRTLTTSNRAGNDSGDQARPWVSRDEWRHLRCGDIGPGGWRCDQVSGHEGAHSNAGNRHGDGTWPRVAPLPCLAEQLADASIWLKHFRGERARVLSDYAYAWLYRAGSRLDERTERALGEPEPVPAAPRYQAPTIEA